jgi:hypothetical protein
MIEITKAEIEKEKINLKREFKMPKIQEGYGIDHIRKIDNAVFKIADILIDKLQDGFQITDAIGIISLYSPAKDIANNWTEAKKEYKDLDELESSQLVSEVLTRALTTAGLDLSYNGTRDISHLMFVLTQVGDLVDVIQFKLQDGYQPEDLVLLPDVTALVIKIVNDISEAGLDAKDLQGAEYVEIARYLTLRIHGALAK